MYLYALDSHWFEIVIVKFILEHQARDIKQEKPYYIWILNLKFWINYCHTGCCKFFFDVGWITGFYAEILQWLTLLDTPIFRQILELSVHLYVIFPFHTFNSRAIRIQVIFIYPGDISDYS